MVSFLQIPMVAFGGGFFLLLKQKRLFPATSCHILYFLHGLGEYCHEHRHGSTFQISATLVDFTV